jgi:hypothetical protein
MPAISHQDNRAREAAPRHCTSAIETLAASISAYFIGSERETEFQAVTERLERIEDILKEIKGRE